MITIALGIILAVGFLGLLGYRPVLAGILLLLVALGYAIS